MDGWRVLVSANVSVPILHAWVKVGRAKLTYMVMDDVPAEPGEMSLPQMYAMLAREWDTGNLRGVQRAMATLETTRPADWLDRADVHGDADNKAARRDAQFRHDLAQTVPDEPLRVNFSFSGDASND